METRNNSAYVMRRLLLYMILVVMSLLACNGQSSEAPDSVGTLVNSNGSLTDIYISDETVFFTTEDGKIHELCADGEVKEVYDASASSIGFDEEVTRAFYIWKHAIMQYDMVQEKETKLFELEDVNTDNSASVICVIGDYLFFRADRINYQFHLKDYRLEAINVSIHQMLTACKEGIIYQTDDYKTLSLYSPAEGKEKILAQEDNTLPITCACYFDGVVIYARSNGDVTIAMTGYEGDVDWDCIADAMKNQYVIDVSMLKDRLVCVGGENEADAYRTFLFTVSLDGEITMIEESNMPLYVVPGSSMLRTKDDRYAFALTTFEVVVSGLIQ